MKPEHFVKLENMYLAAPLNQPQKGKTIEIAEGVCEISLPMQEKFFHAAGALHGSYYFSLMDDSAFFAVNSLVEDVFVLTSSFHIHLLRPVMGGTLKAEGKVTFRSRNLFVAEAHVFNEAGKEVGHGSGNFMKSGLKLEDVAAYRL